MKFESVQGKSVGEIVVADFRAAHIFAGVGIDFCCGGKKTLEESCLEKGIAVNTVVGKLQELENTPSSSATSYGEWNLDFLCDYIVNTHHKYVLKTLPELVAYTQKIAKVHGDNHRELAEVAELFTKINQELLQHLQNEEQVLFPAIKQVLLDGAATAKATIISEIARMEGEHEFAGGAMDKINELTKGYLLPADACNTYRVSLELLKQFEDDLHVHVHLENNILYPKALMLTK